jgi:hypothetical protein
MTVSSSHGSGRLELNVWAVTVTRNRPKLGLDKGIHTPDLLFERWRGARAIHLLRNELSHPLNFGSLSQPHELKVEKLQYTPCKTAHTSVFTA